MNRLSPYGRNALRAPVWVTAPMIQTTPLTLKRVNLTTRVPSLMADAVGEFIAQPVQDTMYLPQRMVFQEHKLGPASRSPLGPATSAIAALTPTGARAVVERLAAVQYSLAQGWGRGDQGLARFSMPMPNDTPALWRRPVMGVPQMPARDRVGPPQALQATDGRRQQQAFDRARAVAEVRASVANQQQAQRAGFRAIVGGR